jgi:hypothetical protein
MALLLVLGPLLTASAQEAPSPQEARRFIEFYYAGQGQGVVLAEARICTGVPHEGAQAYQCVDEVAPDAVQVGRPYHLRMVFVVPQGVAGESITVRYNHEGTLQEVDEVTVSGSIRFRTWTEFTLQEPGMWQIQIARATADDVEELHTLDLRAQGGGE